MMMVGCSRAGMRPLEKIGLHPGHAFLLGGEPIANIGLLGQMETNQGRAPLRRGNHINPSLHDISPRAGPLEFIYEAGAQIIP